MSNSSDKQTSTPLGDSNTGAGEQSAPETRVESKPVDGDEILPDFASMSLEERFDGSRLAHLSDEDLGINAPGSERFWDIPTVNARRHILGEAEDAFKEYEDEDRGK